MRKIKKIVSLLLVIGMLMAMWTVPTYAAGRITVNVAITIKKEHKKITTKSEIILHQTMLITPTQTPLSIRKSCVLRIDYS